MFLQKTFSSALLGLGALFISCNAQAQAADSASSIQPHLVAPEATDLTKKPHTTIRIICKNSITAGNAPLFIIDGKPTQEQDLKSVNPDDVEKIEVLKGSAATALYGSRGANGAILITLKHLHNKPLHQLITKKGRLD